MRHHLNAIDGFLASGRPQQAEEYIRKVRSDIERITPKRYCGNELVNLLCSSFDGKARRMGVRLEVDAKLRGGLPVSDRAGHGCGCRSIQAIAGRRGGLCEFRAQGGIFTLRFMLPLAPAAGADG